MLEDLGARVFYSDEEAKRLLVDDPEARREVIQAFGPQSYREDGLLDREYLAQNVFSEVHKLERINAIVHPRVRARFEAAVEQARNEGVPLMVQEAALIFEAGADRYLDAVAVVDAGRELRIERVQQRDGLSREQIGERMGHQLPPEELRQRADFVIDNSGTLEETKRQVDTLFERLTSDV
jgi:dephospho-CoA kinase